MPAVLAIGFLLFTSTADAFSPGFLWGKRLGVPAMTGSIPWQHAWRSSRSGEDDGALFYD
jgi:hypothetical protein